MSNVPPSHWRLSCVDCRVQQSVVFQSERDGPVAWRGLIGSNGREPTIEQVYAAAGVPVVGVSMSDIAAAGITLKDNGHVNVGRGSAIAPSSMRASMPTCRPENVKSCKVLRVVYA